MSSEKSRDYAYSSTSKSFNFDNLLNTSTVNDDRITSIWCDTSINKHSQHDQYTLNQLYKVNNQVISFTDEEGCLEYIDKFQEKNKLLLIISGSLGRNFVPKICQRSQIYSIYIFCGNKINHESWAKNYEKIKGVFEKITELCEVLEQDKQKLEKEQMRQKMNDSVPILKAFLSSSKLRETYNIINPKYHDDHQPKDDIKKPVTSADIPFSKQVSCSTRNDVEINNNIHYSETVGPYTHYKQQMEFADTGIWPCVSVINSTRNDFVNQLYLSIETLQYFNSTENFLQYFNHHSLDPHFIILFNPTDIEHVSRLIHRRVRRLYIYCSNNRLNEYDTWRDRYSNIICVLQHLDMLTRLIIWDLSACIVDIANYYDGENKKDFAQTRYRYAYRLHYRIQGYLNNTIEMIESTQPVKLNK